MMGTGDLPYDYTLEGDIPTLLKKFWKFYLFSIEVCWNRSKKRMQEPTVRLDRVYIFLYTTLCF